MFKPIKGYNGRYLVSKEGKILSLAGKKPKILVPCINSAGYVESVLVSKNGKRRNEKWHRLVAEAFIPNPNNKPVVNHKNGVKTDNRVKNLEWCSVRENGNHALNILKIHFGPPKGILPKQLKKLLKLDKKRVEEIKMKLKNGQHGIDIAKEYGVSDQTIYDIKNGRCWKKE